MILLDTHTLIWWSTAPDNLSKKSLQLIEKEIEKDGLLVFEIDGVREYKLLGFIPIKSKVKSFVSAENGQVIKTEQSLLGRILNKIAP